MRTILSVIVCIFFFCIAPTSFAQSKNEQFDIASTTSFSVQDSGVTRVTQRIDITNNTEFYYTPTYNMTVSFSNLENVAVIGASGNAIPFTTTKNEIGTKIDISFSERIVGINRQNSFTITFDSTDIARHNGSIWEISIPGVRNIDTFEQYQIQVNVPASFGEPSIIKPQKNHKYSGSTLTFDKNAVGESGIFVVFGSEQYYSFDLDYHISNSNLFPIKTEIALPPSTNYQEVHIDSIDPRPQDVYVDEDGNWLAEYSLSSQQKKSIKVKGKVRVLHTPKPEVLSAEKRKKYLEPDRYWETSHQSIKDVAGKLDSAEAIYDYVVKTLTYDYAKINTDNTRLGARDALTKNSNAVCLEFTDLFVALARSKGIPARAIEGYAYTENDRLRPLSLVQDVLHAWPEYYDDTRKAWVMVDPTWGNTTGGSDYFHVFDFDHITFVKKGMSSEYPIPAGGYKFIAESKDIEMSFAKKDDFVSRAYASLETNLPGEVLSAFPLRGHIVVQNSGNTALYNKNVWVKSTLPIQQNEFEIPILPPFGKSVILLDFQKLPLLTNKKHTVTITFEEYQETRDVMVRVFPHQRVILIGGGIGIGIICLLIIARKSWSLFIQKRSK
jgi:hypothetical protein